jgi:hypothetical protein
VASDNGFTPGHGGGNIGVADRYNHQIRRRHEKQPR